MDADILKVDIEGAELIAFRGLEHFFDANPKVRFIYESNSDACKRLGYDYRDCMRFFEARGFMLYLVRQERFYRTSSADIQPCAVADIIAPRSPLPEIGPFRHAELAPTQIIGALIEQTRAPDAFIRDHVRAEAKMAATSLTEHSRWAEIREAIAQSI